MVEELDQLLDEGGVEQPWWGVDETEQAAHAASLGGRSLGPGLRAAILRPCRHPAAWS
jgi:hypothetical protein